MNGTQLIVCVGMVAVAVLGFRKEIVAALSVVRRNVTKSLNDHSSKQNDMPEAENLTLQLDRLTAACQKCEIVAAVELLRQVAPLVIGHRSQQSEGGDS